MPEHETSATSSSTGSAVTPSRWVRPCRQLWHGLLFVWSTLVVDIVVGTIANLNTTTTDTPLSKLYLIHVAITYPLPTTASIGTLVLLTILSWIGSQERPAMTPLSPSQQNRLHLLHRLRFTYDKMMTDSLQNAAWLELGLAFKPDAVHNVSTLLMRTETQPERLLPAGTSIVEVYEQVNHELLILGEPGTGKSTLLMRLAQHLVEQAIQDEARPLPVILPLSSWSVKHLPLQKWLGKQISLMYGVPRRFSRHWVQEERFLLLLDGLDEMEETARTACIAAINTYHHDHLHALVVCSRTEEYAQAAASEQLALQQAVVVQELTLVQLDAYLVQAGKPLAGLRATVKKNPTLAALATTSLMLHILMLTYQGTSVRQLPNKEAQLRQQIWTDYVEHMVERKGDRKRYPLNQTITWLGWLARQMRQHSQTIFYLEQLQPDWLPKADRIFYSWSVALLVGLFLELGLGLCFWLVSRLGVTLLIGLGFRLFFGLLFWLSVGLLFWLGVGLLVGLLIALVSGLVLGLRAVVQHYTLRFWLWRTRIFPWKAQQFLDDATTRILLRRVGSGYSFVHRLLLDHLADLITIPPITKPKRWRSPAVVAVLILLILILLSIGIYGAATGSWSSNPSPSRTQDVTENLNLTCTKCVQPQIMAVLPSLYFAPGNGIAGTYIRIELSGSFPTPLKLRMISIYVVDSGDNIYRADTTDVNESLNFFNEMYSKIPENKSSIEFPIDFSARFPFLPNKNTKYTLNMTLSINDTSTNKYQSTPLSIP